jgi:hypothetical protein
VKESHATVIAVSGAMLPYRIEGQPIPYIVRAVLGVNNLVLDLDRDSMKIVGRSAEHRDEVKKASAAPVKTDLFLSDHYAHVSAVLYCCPASQTDCSEESRGCARFQASGGLPRTKICGPVRPWSEKYADC